MNEMRYTLNILEIDLFCTISNELGKITSSTFGISIIIHSHFINILSINTLRHSKKLFSTLVIDDNIGKSIHSTNDQ